VQPTRPSHRKCNPEPKPYNAYRDAAQWCGSARQSPELLGSSPTLTSGACDPWGNSERHAHLPQTTNTSCKDARCDKLQKVPPTTQVTILVILFFRAAVNVAVSHVTRGGRGLPQGNKVKRQAICLRMRVALARGGQIDREILDFVGLGGGNPIFVTGSPAARSCPEAPNPIFSVLIWPRVC